MRLRRLIAVTLSTLVAAGCGAGDLVLPSDAALPRLELVRGGGQVASAGSPLGDSLVVRLVDTAGDGIADRAVTWTVSGGGGSVTPTTDTTDGDGLASARWILGPSAGPNTLDAAVAGVGSVTFTSTALSGGGDVPSAGRSAVSADPASIEAGTGTSTIVVTVRDDGGDPVEGATVTLQATGGGNTLTQPSNPTGPDGLATGTLRSSEPGTKTVSATVNGSVQVIETADVTVTSAPATRVELIEGDNQSAPVGTSLPLRPAVRVIDEGGQPVAGAEVTFVVTEGGGSVEGDLKITNAEGIARSGDWTLGSSPGTNTLEARVGSAQGSPVVFHAEGVASGSGTVDHFVFRIQPPDVDKEEFFTVEVAMVDDDGEVVPLSGIEIYIGLFRERSDEPSNDRLQGDRFEDTENGVAVFNLAVSKKGRYRLRALSDELPELGPHGPEPYLFSNPFDVD